MISIEFDFTDEIIGKFHKSVVGHFSVSETKRILEESNLLQLPMA
jgi:hypothetical protein